ncbi:MAG: acyl-CoA dehydrogenase, partial [Microbacterium sp.]
MDLDIDAERASRRQEAEDWLRANLSHAPGGSMDTAAGAAAYRDWERRLADARWSVVHWPE